MATITKLPSGKYRAQIRRQGIYRAQTFARKLDAQAWAAELERSIEGGTSAGVIQPPTGMTLSDVIEAYLRQVRLSKAAELSLAQIGRTIGKTPLRSMNAIRVQDWIAERQADGLVVSSIVRHLGRLSQLLHWARDMKNIDINPELVLEARRKLLRHHPVNTRLRDRIPTPEELERLRTYFREEFGGAAPMDQIMDFALATAMRVGEICRITFEDVDWAQQTVLIRDRKDPKQKIGNNQIVPLLPAALRIVEARKNELGGTGRIFPYRAPYVSETWYHTTRYLKIVDLTFHDLRHAAITDLFRKGLGIPEVALVSGHRSWRELKRYTQLTAADVLGKFRALEQAGG
jgi:integrase